jgi:hypothetical protein
MAGEEDNEAGLAQEPEIGDENLEEEQEEQEEEQLSDLEKEQMAKGWRPKDQFEGDPDDWVSAKKFKETGELLSTIGKLKAETKETRQEMEER